MSQPTDLTAVAATAAIRDGELSSQELFDAYRDRAAADTTNSFTWLAQDYGSAPKGQAADGALAGLPVAVKDLFCVTDVPTAAASALLRGYQPPYTATAVQRLLDQGASVLGKTNQDEFGMGSSNENSAFGPVQNPWDATKIPGGSSGGSAAAVAAGLAPAALGTDTGGSVRQPAAMCGVVGLMPTYGAVSRFGMIAYASSLDKAGPIARNVSDVALLYGQMTGAADKNDATSVGHPTPITLPNSDSLAGLKIGVPSELLGEGVEPGVKAAVEEAIKKAEGLGAAIVEITLPHSRHALAAYYLLAPAEASSNLARFDGVRYGNRAEGADDLVSLYTKTRHDGFGPEVKRRIMLGTYALSSGYYDAYYGRAQQVRTKVVEDFDNAFAQVDLIACPSSPVVAWGLGERVDDPLSMYMADTTTIPFSLAGVPAISIPCGLSDGLPVGLQLAGPKFSEQRVLDAAYALEQVLGFDGSPARVGATTEGGAA